MNLDFRLLSYVKMRNQAQEKKTFFFSWLWKE